MLVGDVDPSSTIGKRLRIGDVLFCIWGKTEPCQKIDDKYFGFLAAFTLEMRGGVCAEVIEVELLKIGAAMQIEERD